MINPNPQRIEDILNQSVQFVVPKYQREYTWTKEAALEFFEDVESYIDYPSASLFLGTLIFDISDAVAKRVKIVDGQQRLTTILILLIACREAAKKINANSLSTLIQNKITFTDPATAESLGCRLVASESIRESFDRIAHSEWDGSFSTRVSGLDGRKLRGQINKLRPVYESFAERLEHFDQPKLSQFLRAVYGTYIVRIDIEKEDEAFDIFERTNARGVDLEASDLLKNYLFAQGVDGLDEAWEQIIDNADGTILRMLKYFYVAKVGYVAKSALYRNLRRYGDSIGATQLVKELDEFSKFYNAIRTATDVEVQTYFEAIGGSAIAGDEDKYQKIHNSFEGLRLFKISQVYPLVYAAISSFINSGAGANTRKSKKLIDLLEFLEKYHFINNAVCQHIGNEVEKLYADFCGKFKDSEAFEGVAESLMAELRNKLAKEEEFVSRFAEISYSGESIPLISYIFDRINNVHLRPGQRIHIFNPDQKVLRRNHNIEHFYPQTPSADMDPEPETLEVVDNIGNLLAISFGTNSKLGNLSPERKLEKLEGPLQREIQNLPYVKEFIRTYKDEIPLWGKAAIDRRAKAMAREAYTSVWKLA